MHWIALVIASIVLYLNRGRGWSKPTQDDISWAESHQDLIERNS